MAGMRRCGAGVALAALIAAMGSGCGHLSESHEPDAVSGCYDGDWYGPNPDQPLGELTCSIESSGPDAWNATFFASFGGFGEYEVGLEGRREGQSVVFGGSVDLGETSGGVFEWNGEIVGGQFLGTYTSQMISGSFKMLRATRPPEPNDE